MLTYNASAVFSGPDERVLEVYRKNGYTTEKDFPREYYFMHNPLTGEKVRIYYSFRIPSTDHRYGDRIGGGHVREYR